MKKWSTNAVSILTSRLSIQIIGALSHLLIIPLLAASDYGSYILLVSIGQLLSPFAHWGLIVPMVTEAASTQSFRTLPLSVYLFLFGLLWILVCVFLVLLTLIGNYFELWPEMLLAYENMAALALGFTLLVCLTNAAELILSQLLVATDRVWESSLASGGIRYITITLLLGIAITLGTAENSLLLVIKITFIGSLLSLAYCVVRFSLLARADQQHFYKNHKRVKPTFMENKETILSMLICANESLGSFLISQFRASAEVIMSSALFGLSIAGALAAARRISGVVLMIAQSLNVIITPYSVRLIQQKNILELERINRMIAAFLLTLCVSSLIIITILFQFDIAHPLTNKYDNIDVYLVIMTLSFALRFYFGSAQQILMNNGFQRIVLKSFSVELIASLLIYAGTHLYPSPTLMIILLGLSQAAQYYWLSKQSQKYLNVRTRII